jgi:hypothetical protein
MTRAWLCRVSALGAKSRHLEGANPGHKKTASEAVVDVRILKISWPVAYP